MGIGRFHFSDRYSIFDWGEMPDQIENKGASLCIMGAYCFEKLEEQGIKTHYRGVLDQNGNLVKTDDLRVPTTIMEINLVRVIPPEPIQKNDVLRYDYQAYTPNLTNFVIPLEIIYRNSLPEGSSIFKRLRDKEISLSDLGLDHFPEEGEELKSPIFDLSTKFEAKDRYISLEEAKRISGLQEDEFCQIRERLHSINQLITRVAQRAGLKNEDGKIELAFDPHRELMVTDVIGTLDECRFTYQGLHVSKEVTRLYYRKTEWYHHLLAAKEEAEREGLKDWKLLCRFQPEGLDPKLKEIVRHMYQATTNECTGLNLFEVPSLSEIIKEYQNYLKENLLN